MITISTPSLHKASHLLACGIEMLGTTTENGRVIFIFPDCDKTHQVIKGFYNNEKVGTHDLYGAIKNLKLLVHEQTNKKEY